jgi:hypothetical protein
MRRDSQSQLARSDPALFSPFSLCPLPLSACVRVGILHSSPSFSDVEVPTRMPDIDGSVLKEAYANIFLRSLQPLPSKRLSADALSNISPIASLAGAFADPPPVKVRPGLAKLLFPGVFVNRTWRDPTIFTIVRVWVACPSAKTTHAPDVNTPFSFPRAAFDITSLLVFVLVTPPRSFKIFSSSSFHFLWAQLS